MDEETRQRRQREFTIYLVLFILLVIVGKITTNGQLIDSGPYYRTNDGNPYGSGIYGKGMYGNSFYNHPMPMNPYGEYNFNYGGNPYDWNSVHPFGPGPPMNYQSVHNNYYADPFGYGAQQAQLYYNQPHYNLQNYNSQPYYNQPQYNQPYFNQAYYNQPQYNQPYFNQAYYNQSNYNHPYYNQPLYNQPHYNQPNQNQWGNPHFNQGFGYGYDVQPPAYPSAGPWGVPQHYGYGQVNGSVHSYPAQLYYNHPYQNAFGPNRFQHQPVYEPYGEQYGMNPGWGYEPYDPMKANWGYNQPMLPYDAYSYHVNGNIPTNNMYSNPMQQPWW